MKIAHVSVNCPTITSFITILLMIAGLASYFSLGQLEDPEFTVKSAQIITLYPGANARQVEQEVTERIEIALQQMPQIKDLESISRPGRSIIQVDIRDEFWADRLPQVWDELRRKIRDIEGELPPGAQRPDVADDFGDVFGFVLAVTGDGFTYAELEDYVEDLKRELSLVPGVARVELWGVQQRCVYLEASQARLAALGVRSEDLQAALETQNLVVNAGSIELGQLRLRIEPTGEFQSPEDIANLMVAPRTVLETQARNELLRIGDIAAVRRGYVSPPQSEMRYNGQPALGIYLSNIQGANIVDLGRRVDARLRQLIAHLPVGLEVHRVAWQSNEVSTAVNSFIISLIEAVAIVIVVLWLTMGFRLSVVIGICGLLLTIIGTLLFMSLMGINLQRMSLGALIIAMGMMVDNAIVVADGVVVRMQQGMNRKQAAIEAASQPAWPLLGATVVAVMAFYPIFASTANAGEYCRSLFQVVGISLLLSWVLSVTITPLMCIWMLPTPKQSEGGDVYDTRMYRIFRRLLQRAIIWRWPFLTAMVILLVASVVSFRWVDKTFFPDSSRPQFMLDYWAPEGTRIEQVSVDLTTIENYLLQQPEVSDITAFIGQGPPRFYLPVSPEKPYPAYAQIIVTLHDYQDVNTMIDRLRPWLRENAPQALTVMNKFGVGPSEVWKIEARFIGPADANPDILRHLAQQASDLLTNSPYSDVVQQNWRQRVAVVVPDYNQQRGRWTNVSRDDVAQATRRGYDGIRVGTFREQDKLLPIVMRHTEAEREQTPANMELLQIVPPYTTDSVPLLQVVNDIHLKWDDGIIWRRNRHRTITVQATVADGSTATELRDDVLSAMEQIKLPPGYELEWGGEYESSTEAQAALIPGVLPAFVIIALIVVTLFNAYRPPLIIALIIPLAMIGITGGLLATFQSFGFMALLGAMSLAGMMIKNAIVLLDQINIEKAAGKVPYQAVLDASVSRLRPVILAAGTTILGVIPLLQDVFWISMSVTIMAGLTFGTILTMLVVPVLYTCFYRIPPRPQAASPEAD